MAPTAPGGPPAPRPRARPLVLFGLLTLMTFLGPLAIVLVGRGGARPTWPPDRPIEWQVFLGVTGGFVLLMLATLLDLARDRGRLRKQEGRRDDIAPPEDRT